MRIQVPRSGTPLPGRGTYSGAPAKPDGSRLDGADPDTAGGHRTQARRRDAAPPDPVGVLAMAVRDAIGFHHD
ncbi:hypothetical protein Lfu02_48250 [Longispora fulva]|nr:hypothetical protein Lfu02_48250 [Longispora fulva]